MKDGLLIPMAARACTISSFAPKLAKDSLLKYVAVFPFDASLLFGAGPSETQDKAVVKTMLIST